MRIAKMVTVLVALAFVSSTAVAPAFGQRGHARGHAGPPPGAIVKPNHPQGVGHLTQGLRATKPPKQIGTTGKHHGPPRVPPGRAEGHAKPPDKTPAKTHVQAQAELARNPILTTKLQPLLPPRTDLSSAALGFRNLGQFVAAIHVSHNLGIPFDQLRARMVGPHPMSLGQAIQDLRPTSDWRFEQRRAEEAAEILIRTSREERREARNRRDRR
ncbi:MAG: hypothetical protein HYZ58_01460 [Acidobacteria bacterium]|nr:hypothetical protein [Acidobacteriota bacterium]MBI3261802.1 hypothetical protein [Acidobacteriota bacterium]